MEISIPYFTFLCKKATGGLCVVPCRLPNGIVSGEYEIIYEHSATTVTVGTTWKFADLAHILFLSGARWARENPDKEIRED